MSTTTLPVYEVRYTDRYCKPCSPESARYIDFLVPYEPASRHEQPYMSCVGVAYAKADGTYDCHDIRKGGAPYLAGSLSEALAWGLMNFCPALSPA